MISAIKLHNASRSTCYVTGGKVDEAAKKADAKGEQMKAEANKAAPE